MKPFEKAANMMMDELEALFGLVYVNGRRSTIKAVVAIMEHYSIEKTDQQIKECACAICQRCKASTN